MPANNQQRIRRINRNIPTLEERTLGIFTSTTRSLASEMGAETRLSGLWLEEEATAALLLFSKTNPTGILVAAASLSIIADCPSVHAFLFRVLSVVVE
jgi:hypothetical protein